MILRKIGILLVVLMVVSCMQKNRMLQTNGFSDPFCAIFDQQTGQCVACICRGYFNKNRQCKAVSDLCQTWNINTGQCTSCYRGYELVNSTCIALQVYIPGGDPNQTIENSNCKTDNGNGTCLSCRPYYILYCGDCQTTGENPFCAKFDQDNTCLECDPGYKLDANDVCQLLQNNSSNGANDTKDSNSGICNQFDNCLECNQQECTKCQQGYRQQFESRKCVLTSTNCSQGCALCSPNECFACEAGYSAQSWPICINCSFMFARNSQGKCVAILRDCSDFPNCQSCVVGECRLCKEGFTLDADQKCVV